jgi:hypothetical protein
MPSQPEQEQKGGGHDAYVADPTQVPYKGDREDEKDQGRDDDSAAQQTTGKILDDGGDPGEQVVCHGPILWLSRVKKPGFSN